MTLRSPMRFTRLVGTASAASFVVIVTPNVFCLHATPKIQVNNMRNKTKQRLNNITHFIGGTYPKGTCGWFLSYPEGLLGHHALRGAMTEAINYSPSRVHW